MNSFKERLRSAIKEEAISAFADRCGITEGIIRKYLIGPTLPGFDKLIAIANAAQVNIEWLVTGKGPMMSDSEKPLKYDEELLQAVIEASESYWIKEGKDLSPSEKADMITSVYVVSVEMNMSNDKLEIEKVIKDSEKLSEKFDAEMDMYAERMADPVNGAIFRKSFEIHLKKIFKGGSFNKKTFEFFIDDLIGSYILRKHMKEGTLKFPVKNEDGTIRMVNIKDLKAEKDPKNQKPQ